MSVRNVFALVIVLALLVGAAGTMAQDGPEEFDPNQAYSIVVPSGTFYNEEAVAAAFMEKYPNVTVTVGVDYSDSQDEAAFLTKAASGEIDDLFGGGDENPDMYGPRGIYIDLKPYLEADAELWFNDEEFMNWWIYENPDGAIYSVPVVGNPMVVFYNKQMLEAAGLEAPPMTYDDPAYVEWTWDKFHEYAVALTTDDVWGVGIENNILIYWPFIYANGGRIVNEDLTDYTIDDPAVVEALDFLTSFTLDGYAPDPSGAMELGGMQELFNNGQIAMFVAGAWNAGGVYDDALENFGFDVGIATLPYNTVKENFVLCPAMRQGISAYSTAPAAAYEYMKFLYFEADDIILAHDLNPWITTYPAIKLGHQLYDDDLTVNASYGSDEVDLRFLMDNHCGPDMIMQAPPWNGPFPETRDITLAELGLVFSGEQSLENAIANINEQADQVLMRWQRSNR